MPHREIDKAALYEDVRIGSVVNFLTGEIDALCRALDMAKLSAAGAIGVAGSPLGIKSMQADAYSTECQNAWSTDKGKKAKVGAPFCRVAIESHTTASSSQMATAKGSSLTVGMAILGYKISLLHQISPDVLFACASDVFKERLKAVAAAGTIEDWRAAYREFENDFGHGFVSELHLISCASGELTTSEKTDGIKQENSFSRSTAGGGVCDVVSGGASVASGWATAHAASGSDEQLSATSKAVPYGSPCDVWVSNVLTKYTDVGLSNMASVKPSTIPDAPVAKATLPDIPDVEPPDKGKEPLPKAASDVDTMAEKKRSDQMQDDGVPPETGWDKYQKQLGDQARNLDENEVAQEAGEAAAPTSTNVDPVRSQGPGLDTSTGAGEVQMKDFFIYDLVVTPYAEVFPNVLKAMPGLSKAALYLAKIHMFISTRQLIASYFNFVVGLPKDVTGGYVKEDDAIHFQKAVESYIEEVSGVPRFNEQKYKEMVFRFGQVLTEKKFSNVHAYQYVVRNFNYLSNAPYGFLLTAEKRWYPKWGSWQSRPVNYYELTDYGFDLDRRAMIQEAYRAFPVPVSESDTKTVGFGFVIYVPRKSDNLKDSWLAISADGTLVPGGRAAAFDLCSIAKTDYIYARRVGPDTHDSHLHVDQNNGNLCFRPAAGQNANTQRLIEFWPIDYETVNGVNVHGIPMWYEMPFDAIRNSVTEAFL